MNNEYPYSNESRTSCAKYLIRNIVFKELLIVNVLVIYFSAANKRQ